MTTSERIIKFFAIFLAITIILGIIGIFVWLISIFTNSYDNKPISLKEYDVYDVTDVEMNIGSANLVIQKGDTFKLEISEYTSYTVSGNKLYVENKNRIYRKNDKVILTIPEGKNFSTFTFDGGAGSVKIDEINADKVILKLGAGKTTVDNIIANTLKVDAGVGDFRIYDSIVDSFDVDLGVGNVDIKTQANEGYIDVGVGNLTLILKDGLDNYTSDLEKGLGKITYDGTSVSTGKYGNGEAKIKVNGGIGNIKIGD